MANNNNLDPQESFQDELLGCFGDVGFGCLFELLLSGIGCIVPTLLVAFMFVYGAKVSARPAMRMGTRVVTRVQQLRRKSTSQIVDRLHTSRKWSISGYPS
jgi:hypothetical protein